MTGCGKSKETATEKIAEPNVTIKTSKENSEEKETDEIRAKEEESKQESETQMELKGVTEGLLSVLEVEEETVEKELQKWTSKNGYVSAAGVVFYDPMWISFSEDKYSIDGYLLFEQEGNGIRPEGEQKKITMDYYKTKKRIEFHE